MSKKNLIIVIILLLALIIGIAIGVLLYTNGSLEKVKETPTHTVGIDDLYCNIKDSKKMVKINIIIETNDHKLKEDIANKKFLIRDLTNEIIVSKTEDDLLKENGQADLKKEILASLVEVFESQKITNIYFNDFIIQ